MTEPSWLLSACLQAYPKAWRTRYGEEFVALLEDTGTTPGVLLDVLSGAMDAHIRKRVTDRAATRIEDAIDVGKGLAMGTTLGLVLSVVIGVWAVLLQGGDLAAFVIPPPIMLVWGGTACALLIAHGGRTVLELPSLVGKAVRGRPASLDADSEETYRRGAGVFRDAGHFALLCGTVATLLGAIVSLSHVGDATAGQVAHGFAITLTAIVHGLVIAIFSYAISANLRSKSEGHRGTVRALAGLSGGQAPDHRLAPAAGVS